MTQITFTVPGTPVPENIHELLSYDERTGIFRWKSSKGFRVAGAIAGSKCKRGYVCIGAGGKIHKAHRLAWFFVYGKMPQGQIDHIDRDKSNNRISNLRDVQQSMNQENRVDPRADNKLKSTGVSKWTDGRPGFKAQIKIRGKVHYLGTFNDKDTAHQAYLDAKKKHHEGAML